MTDIEKVIQGLECCRAYYVDHDLNGHKRCQYNGLNGGKGCDQLRVDALELLKEQKKMAELIEALKIDIDILANDIGTNNCNTCKRQCEHMPMPGEVVRSNCFMWDGGE